MDSCGKNCTGSMRHGNCGGPGSWNGPCGDPSCAGCFGPGVDHYECPQPTKCEPCTGTGTVFCPDCDGDGQHDTETGTRRCFVCDGEGVVACTACGGEGEL